MGAGKIHGTCLISFSVFHCQLYFGQYDCKMGNTLCCIRNVLIPSCALWTWVDYIQCHHLHYDVVAR